VLDEKGTAAGGGRILAAGPVRFAQATFPDQFRWLFRYMLSAAAAKASIWRFRALRRGHHGAVARRPVSARQLEPPGRSRASATRVFFRCARGAVPSATRDAWRDLLGMRIWCLLKQAIRPVPMLRSPCSRVAGRAMTQPLLVGGRDRRGSPNDSALVVQHTHTIPIADRAANLGGSSRLAGPPAPGSLCMVGCDRGRTGSWGGPGGGGGGAGRPAALLRPGSPLACQLRR